MKTFLILFFSLLFTASSLNDARKANDAFRSGDYETAVSLYNQAIENNPNDARLHFNLGSALARLGQAEQSVRAFERAKELMDDPQQQAMADYNAGTLLSESEMYDEALDFFRNALRKNPNDPDTKHNYEMSVRKQQEQQEQDQQQDQDDQSDDDEEQDQDQQQDQDDQSDDEQDQDQDQNEDQGDGSPEDQDPRDHELPQPDEISQDEAENILNALEQLEREILENRKKEAEDASSSSDKDW
ncbi:tetratricopeptide repeat protein [Rhodohalobacter sp. SW132]|uniref:tetratricopeptide repeat protein n=1 Tax=Rhodohalobacter sp. SW132 TaxID=2293433 RepID=UPI0011C05F20|nr:tetratricopeptide repeat protein [Rhodohalobacter sp. SW132]